MRPLRMLRRTRWHAKTLRGVALTGRMGLFRATDAAPNLFMPVHKPPSWRNITANRPASLRPACFSALSVRAF